ncbi:hypothetical protein [Salinarimonas chemoclinalis]|uniref:hypothetical protein n=1 Tax=Salinarimonas chemoclinalis TaxID=3241599 RepID=UPI003555E3CC
MSSGSQRSSATLIPFPLRPAPIPAIERSRELQKRLMDAVFASGALEVDAQDTPTKRLAARLQILGFVAIEEITESGDRRRLRASEAIEAEPGRDWRISRAGAGACIA